MDARLYARDAIHRLPVYDPGHDLVALRAAAAQGLIELGSNENPYGPSPTALQAATAALQDAHRYPDPRAGALRVALAAHWARTPDCFIVGNGSHELLMQCAQVFAGAPGDEVVFSQYGFAVYPLAALAAGATPVSVPALPIDHPRMPRGHDLPALAAAITPRTRLLYIANPNNPTGTWFGADAFARFLEAVPPQVVVVVDEAYAEFVDDPAWRSAAHWQAQFPNVLVTRTFSKAYALAGLRVGYAVGHPRLIDLLERVRESFNVNLPGLAAAVAALQDTSHLQAGIAANAVERVALAGQLRARGWQVAPSQTNFLLVTFGDRAARIEAALLARGVVLRPMGGYGLSDCLRITVGTAADNARLLAALDSLEEATP